MHVLTKRLLIFNAKAATLIIVLWFLIQTSQLQIGLSTKVFQHPVLLASTIFLYFLVILICAQRWFLLNSVQGIHLGFSETVRLTYIGTAFNTILPGAVGGDFFRFHYLFKKCPEKKNSALLSILLDRIIGLMAIFILICLFAISHIILFKHPHLSNLLLICTTICIVGTGMFFASMLLPQRLGISYYLAKRFSNYKCFKFIISFLDAMRVYRNAKITITICLLLSVLMLCVIVLIIQIIAKIMDLPDIQFSHYIIALGVALIANLIPVTPGGIGVGEVAFANVLLIFNPSLVGPFATVFFINRLIGITTFLPAMFFCSPQLSYSKKISDHIMSQKV